MKKEFLPCLKSISDIKIYQLENGIQLKKVDTILQTLGESTIFYVIQKNWKPLNMSNKTV